MRPRLRQAGGGRPCPDLESAVEALDRGGAAFQPVAAIDVADAQPVMDRRMMDMPADHAVGLMAGRKRRDLAFELAEIVDAFATGKLVDYKDPRYSNAVFLNHHSDLPQVLLEDSGRREWGTLPSDDGTLPESGKEQAKTLDSDIPQSVPRQRRATA